MMKRAFAFGRRLFLFGDQRWNRWERGLELVEATDDFEAGSEVLIFAF